MSIIIDLSKSKTAYTGSMEAPRDANWSPKQVEHGSHKGADTVDGSEIPRENHKPPFGLVWNPS